MLLVAGCCEKWTHTHTRSQFVSVNVANHPHILVLPRREQPEDKQQLLSHHLALSYIHHTLSLSLFLFSPYHPLIPSLSSLPPASFASLPASLSPFSLLPCPNFLPQSTLSLSSHSCIDFHKASPVISPYLLIPTLTPSLSLHLAGLFPFSHTNTISSSLSIVFFFISSYLHQAHIVFPFQVWLLLISCSTSLSISSKIYCTSFPFICVPLTF